MIIVSEIKVQKGFAYFCTNSHKLHHEISFFVTPNKINPHEVSFWEDFDEVPFKNHEGDFKLQTHKGIWSTADFGDATRNLLKISDIKKLKEELKNLIEWVHSLGKEAHFYPCDKERHKGTKFLLRNLPFEIGEHIFKEGDSFIAVRRKTKSFKVKTERLFEFLKF